MIERIQAPIVSKTVQSADGTDITYHVAGKGKKVWIIPPGLGTPVLTWKYVIEQFQDQYTIVTWDIRGTYQSQTPADLDHFSMDYQIDDLCAIVKAEKFGKFILGGWSMAVQTSLEYYHRFPKKVRALVLINGAYEYVLNTAFQIPGAPMIFPAILQFFRRFSPVMNPLLNRLLGMDSTVALLNRMQIVSANFEFFGDLVREFHGMDLNVYFKLMLDMNQHSAGAFLTEVSVPTLIFAGTKDKMTPVSTAEKMARDISGAQLFLVPNGTHYTIAEYPEIVNLRLEKFFGELDPKVFAAAK
jgi:pimeloyl-ACP methyl ester carboxylesterase